MTVRPYDEPADPDQVDSDEERIRRALWEAVAGLEPSPWRAGPVLDRAKRRRRARWIGVTVPAVAVITVSVGLFAAGARFPATEVRVMPAGPAGADPSATGMSTAAPWPSGSRHNTPPSGQPSATNPEPVRIVAPGRAFSIGHGQRMRLEPARRCVDQGDHMWNCKSVVDGNQAAGSVSLQSGGDRNGVMYTPLYIGRGTVVRMSLEVEGRTYPVRVVSLAGRPGYATGYVEAPAFSARSESKITVYGAGDKVLTSLP